jgi:hypothetical protein
MTVLTSLGDRAFGGPSLAGIVCSNPSGDMDVRLL